MATVTVGGVEIDIPTYKFRELKASAPFIDRVLATRRDAAARAGESSMETAERLVSERDGVMQEMTGALTDVLGVIAVGVIKSRGDFPYSPVKIAGVVEELESELSMDEVSLLSGVFDQILREAGMVRARPLMAPVKEETSSPSPSASTESSPNSSQPVAPEETGTE